MTGLHLFCNRCHHSQPASREALLVRLQDAGLLKRASREERKDLDYLAALARTVAGRWLCPSCGAMGLAVEEADPASDDFDAGRPCAACGKKIPAERTELFPDTTLCTACQS